MQRLETLEQPAREFAQENELSVNDEQLDCWAEPLIGGSVRRTGVSVYASIFQNVFGTVDDALLQLFYEKAARLKEWVILPGAAAFSLYETYGVPVDYIVDAARDAGIVDFDMAGFRAGEGGGAGAGSGELEGWVAEECGAGVSEAPADGV